MCIRVEGRVLRYMETPLDWWLSEDDGPPPPKYFSLYYLQYLSSTLQYFSSCYFQYFSLACHRNNLICHTTGPSTAPTTWMATILKIYLHCWTNKKLHFSHLLNLTNSSMKVVTVQRWWDGGQESNKQHCLNRQWGQKCVTKWYPKICQNNNLPMFSKVVCFWR